MKTWQTLLRHNDPAGDHRLSADEWLSMRRSVVMAAREPQPRGADWQRPLAMAAIVLLMIGAGVSAGRRAAERDRAGVSADVPLPADDPAGRRQLQFSTPGGTRIIWVFNPEFDIKATIP